MSDELFKQIRTAAKGSGWSVKRDVLVKRAGDHVLAVHPRRGSQGILEFRAKPIAWDHLLWSILQIEANMKQPSSFHFTGAFICDTPALLQEAVKPQVPPLELAQHAPTGGAGTANGRRLAEVRSASSHRQRAAKAAIPLPHHPCCRTDLVRRPSGST
ncbi:hypothetical protein [Pannonibacter phragmitetus]|uniref:hypothetical protein n=1 Tax=Pannonibacter phragmitetus TaxID=121719 RepID=UPI0012FE5C09|nr:hypothetical protein [Pannonibacter phragmitetus]